MPEANDTKAIVLGDTPQIEAPRRAFFDKYYAVVKSR
jgi:hypothetical protein